MGYRIIDNFLDIDVFKLLEFSICHSNLIPWEYNYPQVDRYKNMNSNLFEEKKGYTYFLSRGKDNESKFNFLSHSLLNQIYNRFNIRFAVSNVRVNKNFCDSKNNHVKYDVPHVDLKEYYEKTYTCIYYLNDSEGTTLLFKNKSNGSNYADMIESDLIVDKEVEAKKNRFLIFDANTLHSGPSFFQDERFVFNINISTEYSLNL